MGRAAQESSSGFRALPLLFAKTGDAPSVSGQGLRLGGPVLASWPIRIRRLGLKWSLSLLGAAFVIGPILFWILLTELGCAYANHPDRCGVALVDFFNEDFAMVAALPWVLALACFLAARSFGRSGD